ncbi:nuclear transport factor 2 family protein [Mycobacterium sp. CVI_P3]|uniref:Nuclear transport factor 2 family protein n=1 Tax=Mycobacterium pinniadriaticum TaxID=2994102 RepID=A0ABT3S8Y6_9MYCO|nr:nuclear transport factor 2 family protein [Mycobacterium pinniadriaticum]MCX2929536.1 nuclear transport factor 2 family protein [Mycobacterium pinniadriaticum]MCX2935960.1 nuclear transport factor 2 family protein [Mycobacterium pinniadriaticum]
MSRPPERAEIARAFAQHRFDEALRHLARDVQWTIVGYSVLEGADAVTATCRETAGGLAGTVATWDRCLTVEQDDTVVVEVLGRYQRPDGVTIVSSCHICRFTGADIASITSYGVEVDPDSVGAPADVRRATR